jgi:post-segregation antitoxin (ccd killing protein)
MTNRYDGKRTVTFEVTQSRLVTLDISAAAFAELQEEMKKPVDECEITGWAEENTEVTNDHSSIYDSLEALFNQSPLLLKSSIAVASLFDIDDLAKAAIDYDAAKQSLKDLNA